MFFRMLRPVTAALFLVAAVTAQDPDLGFGLNGFGGDRDKATATGRFDPTTARAGEIVTIEAVVVIDDGWHIYGGNEEGAPSRLVISDAGALELVGDPDVPPGEPHEAFGIVSHWVEGEAIFRQQARVPAGTAPGTIEVGGHVAYMACTEETCDRAKDAKFTATLTVEAGEAREGATEVAATPVDPPDEDKGAIADVDDVASKSLSAFLLAAIFWGLLTLAMPCTYPMIPITISFFTKQADQRGGKVLPLALTYGFGIIAIFVLIGVVVGDPIVRFAASPITNLVIAALFFVFALSLFGVFTLKPPQFLMRSATSASQQGGYVGVFLMGATLVVTSFTCTAPFVGSLLAFGANADGGLGRVVLGMAVFGATMALPFVFLSLAPGRMKSMPRSGEWMNTLKVFLGFVEIAAALKFLSNVDLAWHWQLLSRELFLFLWAGIFGIAGFHLLGVIRLKGEGGEVGPGRLVSGLSVVLLAIFFAVLGTGGKLGWIMSAIAPPYSSRVATAAAGPGEGQPTETLEAKHEIVIDDYDKAREIAIATNRKLLLNFTGVT
ncbi:MAG: cytochrome c biogenesis protein CcdA [Planctomycetota bacterium]